MKWADATMTVQLVGRQKRRFEERICLLCGTRFFCRSDNKTFTCSNACRMRAVWNTRRLDNR